MNDPRPVTSGSSRTPTTEKEQQMTTTAFAADLAETRYAEDPGGRFAYRRLGPTVPGAAGDGHPVPRHDRPLGSGAARTA